VKILFIHQNCPGQFKHLAPHIAADKRHEVVFISHPGKPDVPNVRKVEYKPGRKVSQSTHRYLRLMEEGVLNGQGVVRVALKLKEEGFYPDVVVAHMGWGEGLYVKTVWPHTQLLGYFEWFYHAFGSDVDFDPNKQPTHDDACRLFTRNGLHLLNLQTADRGLSPTRWQWQQHPKEYRSKIAVIHDGVDVEKVRPNPEATGTLREGLRLKAGDEVVTYVARNLEPYRGFPTFMQAAELILKRRPNTHILVVGGDDVSYGSKRQDGKSYREHVVEELDLDLSRIHFLGKVPYARYLQVLQISAVHVYLTYPFVLSWSMMEAMAAGCLVVGSRTPPVEEVIKDGHNGFLVNFFAPMEIADRVDAVLNDPDRMQRIRKAARQTIVQRYSLTFCLNKQMKMIEDLAKKSAARMDSKRQTKAKKPASDIGGSADKPAKKASDRAK